MSNEVHPHEIRRELEALRDRLGVSTPDLLEALAAMLVEDAVLARLEAEAVQRSRPGLAMAHAQRAQRATAFAAAIAQHVRIGKAG